MTLAEFRGIKGPGGEDDASDEPAHAAVGPGERPHPGPLEYVQIGLALAFITAVEVAVYYIEALEGVLIPMLLFLSGLKFTMVALWFMHLRFDNRMFSTFFVGGLALAFAIFMVVLATLGSGLV